jgi:hypothetical protein
VPPWRSVTSEQLHRDNGLPCGAAHKPGLYLSDPQRGGNLGVDRTVPLRQSPMPFLEETFPPLITDRLRGRQGRLAGSTRRPGLPNPSMVNTPQSGPTSPPAVRSTPRIMVIGQRPSEGSERPTSPARCIRIRYRSEHYSPEGSHSWSRAVKASTSWGGQPARRP